MSFAMRASGLDRDGQRNRQPGVDASGDRAQLVRAAIVAEDVVPLEAHLAQVLDALAVAIGRVDLVADGLGQRDLRGRQSPRGGRRLVKAGEDLEVDVRPSADIAGREDALEGREAVRIGGLNAAEVVLAGDALAVEGVSAFSVAMPGVDGSTR